MISDQDREDEPIANFAGNPKLKKVGQQIGMTKNELKEYAKCASDPLYFIENYVNIVSIDHGVIPFTLYNYQKKMVRSYHNNNRVIVRAARQSGKALSLDTKIPTPYGFTTMGEIEVGDTVLDAKGNPTKVTFATEVMENRDCYEIEFDSGHKVLACSEHRWEVNLFEKKKLVKKVMTTQELVELLPKIKSNSQSISISYDQIVEYSEKELPIDPYLFGLWLGDGDKNTSRIACHRDDYKIYKDIISTNYEISEFMLDKRTKDTGTFTIYGLITILKENSLYKNKHIPEIYKRSSVKQRLELIRGLMDSDGYSSKETGACYFYQKNIEIIDSVREIFSSLGIKTRINKKFVKGELYHSLTCSTHKFELFKLPRKIKNQKKLQGNYQLQNIYFKGIKKVDSVPVRCIQVDNADHLFLCTDGFITTHNTATSAAYLLWFVLFNSTKTVAILANKETIATEILSRVQEMYMNVPKWLQQGVVEWNKRSFLLENKSRIISAATSSNAIRGFTIALLFLDEFAHVPNHTAVDFFTSVYPTLSSGKTAKLIICSTPRGMNMFYKLFSDAENGKNEFKPMTVTWDKVPGRNKKWADDQKQTLGEERFLQEQCVSFDTQITVRNKETGIIETISIGEFYDRLE